MRVIQLVYIVSYEKEKRAIIYYGYAPNFIQTDNGIEFTYTREAKDDREYLLDKFCSLRKIILKAIKPQTPRHNGKVERSHRNDNERSYLLSLMLYSLNMV